MFAERARVRLCSRCPEPLALLVPPGQDCVKLSCATALAAMTAAKRVQLRKQCHEATLIMFRHGLPMWQKSKT